MAMLFACMVAYGLFFGWLSLERYWTFQMHALDMGNMSQAAWNTIHGHPFRFSNMRLGYYNIEAWGTTTRLSFHVEALFPFIALAYFVYPHPESLLVLQTLALTLGAVPVFLLARDVIGNSWLALVFAIAYLLFPSLAALNLYEFHPVALATPLLLAAFLFAWRRRYVPFVLCSLAAMGTKEQIGLVVALLGLYVAIHDRNARAGYVVALLGIGWSLFAVFVIEHHFRQPLSTTYLHTRYGYAGHGLHGLLHTMLRNPGAIGNVILTWEKLGYLERLLLPVGYLGVLSPVALTIGAPTVLLNIFSNDFHMSTGLGDNSAELIAISVIAAILGCRRLVAWFSLWLRRRTALMVSAAWLLAVVLWNQHENGFTPLGPNFQMPVKTNHARLADKFIAMVPHGAPVSTQDQLNPHLSDRGYTYLFKDTGRDPNNHAPANIILLDASAETYPLTSFENHDAALQWIHRPGWGVSAAQDGLILIKKGSIRKRISPSFYSFMHSRHKPQHRLSASVDGIQFLGYDSNAADLPNHRVPNVAYTIHLRLTHFVTRDLQPVLFETMGGKPIGCDWDALGLAWMPTSRWNIGQQYVVRLRAFETNSTTPGTAKFYLGVATSPKHVPLSCSSLWQHRGRLLPVGTLAVHF